MASEREGRTNLTKSQGHILTIVSLNPLRQREQPEPGSGEMARFSGNLRLAIFQVCVFLWLVSALPSYAQKATGGIQGTLTDGTGAAVAGATITLIDEAGGRTLAQQSDAEGVFRFLELKPASYFASVGAHGFKETKIEHVVVLVSQIRPAEYLTPGW